MQCTVHSYDRLIGVAIVFVTRSVVTTPKYMHSQMVCLALEGIQSPLVVVSGLDPQSEI